MEHASSVFPCAAQAYYKNDIHEEGIMKAKQCLLLLLGGAVVALFVLVIMLSRVSPELHWAFLVSGGIALVCALSGLILFAVLSKRAKRLFMVPKLILWQLMQLVVNIKLQLFSWILSNLVVLSCNIPTARAMPRRQL